MNFLRPWKRDAIESLLRAGHSDREIERRTGTDRGTVRNVRISLGLPPISRQKTPSPDPPEERVPWHGNRALSVPRAVEIVEFFLTSNRQRPRTSQELSARQAAKEAGVHRDTLARLRDKVGMRCWRILGAMGLADEEHCPVPADALLSAYQALCLADRAGQTPAMRAGVTFEAWTVADLVHCAMSVTDAPEISSGWVRAKEEKIARRILGLKMLREGRTDTAAIAKATGAGLDTIKGWRGQLRRERPGWRWQPDRSREPVIEIFGSFLGEDMKQERALAELEGRAFDASDFYRRHCPRRELAILDRPMGDGDGATMHEVVGRSEGDAWLSPRTSGGNHNWAEERLVRILDREPSIEELRAGATPLPWLAYIHAVNLEQAEPAVCAWLEFIARMTPEEYAETNIEAQIEAILPGLTMGEALRAVREALGWTERDLERQASVMPGTVGPLERGIVSYRTCPFQAIAAALTTVADLNPGLLKEALSTVWGKPPDLTAPPRPVIMEAQRKQIERQRGTLTQNLGDLLRSAGA